MSGVVSELSWESWEYLPQKSLISALVGALSWKVGCRGWAIGVEIALQPKLSLISVTFLQAMLASY